MPLHRHLSAVFAIVTCWLVAGCTSSDGAPVGSDPHIPDGSADAPTTDGDGADDGQVDDGPSDSGPDEDVSPDHDCATPPCAANWPAEDGYVITGALAHGQTVTVRSVTVSFGEKPGGGPPLLWDFGTEVFVNGQPDPFNSGLAHLQEISGSPLYGTESPRRNPQFYKTGERLRHDRSAGHYLAVHGDSDKAGAYFMGVGATNGKTSTPAPFRDNRYYFSMRVVYPDGVDDNSLKTLRGSQRDSQQEGWHGSKAANINKFQMSYHEDNVQIWPPEYQPVWSGKPSGWADGIKTWHLEELFIDPTGSIESGRVWMHTVFYFEAAGRQDYPLAVHPSAGSAHMPVEYWEADRGFYHQVGPEPAGYDQPDYHFGEVYVDDSFKRVYLADAPQWDDVKAVELQRITQWTDDEIRFVLNLGALSADQPLYLFWVDNLNAAHLAGRTL